MDTKTTKQIFDILKNISKETLVIVVTHDTEIAKKYSKDIIELKDGLITKNSLNKCVLKKENNNYSLKNTKSKIKTSLKFKLSISSLKHKKIRLPITIILCSVGFTTFCLSNTLNSYNEYEVHSETMLKENNTKIMLTKKRNTYNNYFTEQENSKINNLINAKTKKYAVIVENDKTLNLNIGDFKPEYSDNAFYRGLNELYYTIFEILEKADIQKLNIVGNYPQNAHEVLLTESFVEFIYAHKFKTINEGKIIDTEINSKEEIIDKIIPIENNFIKVVGFIKDGDLSKYESLKKDSYNEQNAHPTKIFQDFLQKYSSNNEYDNTINKIIVGPEFFHLTNLKPNYKIESSLYKQILKFDDYRYYSLESKIIHDKVNYYDGNQNLSADYLEDDEILLSNYDAINLFKEEFDNKFNQARDKALENYKKELEKYNNKLTEYSSILDENPNFIIPNITEPKYPNLQLIEQTILRNILKEHNVYNNYIDLEIIDNDNISQNERTTIHRLKVKGFLIYDKVTFENYNTSILSQKYKNFTLPNQVIKEIDIYEKDKNSIIEIFNKIESENELYNIKTSYSDAIKSTTSLVTKALNILKIISTIFLIFSIFLISNFLNSTINNNQKNIGILKSLGISTKNCIDIFLVESLIIGSITYIISLIMSSIATKFINIYISSNVGFYLNILHIDNQIYILMLIGVIISIILSVILPVIKLMRLKPIEIIYKN